MGTAGIISGLIGIALLLLRYYPGWRRRRDAEKDEEVMDEFGEALVGGDDMRVSGLLDAEYRRVRGRRSAGNP